jgi:hypothetical protein
MIDLETFIRSEDIADLTNQIDGYCRALLYYLDAKLLPDDEKPVYALIAGIEQAAKQAQIIAGDIARSGKEPEQKSTS